jgi:ribonuclease III
MNQEREKVLRELEADLGCHFADIALLDNALTHRSFVNENPGLPVKDNERLEFLGDAVLALAIADLLLEAHPRWDEGQLSKRRASLVRASTLAAKGRELGLGKALHLGRGEERSGGRSKRSILACTYEAVIGAVFRDGGFERVRAVIARHFAGDLGEDESPGPRDWKTILQEHTQEFTQAVPEYRVVDERGPAHAPWFIMEVRVGERCLGRGEGASKREAEQQAARAALCQLGSTDADG